MKNVKPRVLIAGFVATFILLQVGSAMAEFIGYSFESSAKGSVRSSLEWLNSHAPAAGIVVSVLLGGFSVWTALITRSSVRIARDQYDREWHAELFPEFVPMEHHDAIDVTNLGKASALLRTIQFKLSSSEKLPAREFERKEIIHSGRTTRIPLTKYVRDFLGISSNRPLIQSAARGGYGPILVRFSFHSAGQLSRSEWFPFEVEGATGRLKSPL